MMIKQNRGRQWLDWRRRMIRVAQIIGLAACAWLLIALFVGEMGLPRYIGMRNHATELEHELADLRLETDALRDEVLQLRKDPAKIERLARERLGYVRKGETVYQVSPDSDRMQEQRAKP